MATAIDELRTIHREALGLHRGPSSPVEGLVRAWPSVAVAAFRLQRSAGLPDPARVVERIAIGSVSVGRVGSRDRWPGRGVADGQLVGLAQKFDEVAAVGSISERQHIEAVQSIVSTLWLTSNLVGTAARDHALDVRFAREPGVRSQMTPVEATALDVAQRVSVGERLASAALSGEAPGVSAIGPRAVVGTWDVAAQSALLSQRSTAVLHVLAHHEAMIGQAFTMAVDAAASGGGIDQGSASRLRPVMAEVSQAWNEVLDLATDLSWGSTQVPRQMLTAADMVRDEFRSVALHDTRRDHTETVAAFTTHLASSVTIAAAAHDLARDGELRAPARAVARLLREHDDGIRAQVSPVDIQRGTTVPLPMIVREDLQARVARVYAGATEAFRRSAGLDALDRRTERAPHREPQVAVAMGAPAPAVVRDRVPAR